LNRWHRSDWVHIRRIILILLIINSYCLQTLLLSYEKIKHIAEVDENILAVFTINSEAKISDVFIAPDANIDRSFIEIIRSELDFKFEVIDKAATTAVTVEEGPKDKEKEKEKLKPQTIGKHLWDISEYDNTRIIMIYEANRLIVVLAKSHTPPGDTADAVLGYLYECNEDEQDQQEESPPCLF
jgi:hypothetical protein